MGALFAGGAGAPIPVGGVGAGVVGGAPLSVVGLSGGGNVNTACLLW